MVCPLRGRRQPLAEASIELQLEMCRGEGKKTHKGTPGSREPETMKRAAGMD